MPSSCAECCELLCSVIFPPLGVFAKRGCGLDLAINILLTILGYFPGLIHATIIVCCTPQAPAGPVVVVQEKV
eukprot:gene11212-13052_t